jgi:hypothetical protein
MTYSRRSVRTISFVALLNRYHELSQIIGSGGQKDTLAGLLELLIFEID